METKTRFYVTTTDKFMSGWGKAKDLTNKLIFICDNHNQALTVYDNAINRSDQKNVNICESKPNYFRPNKGTDYNLNNYYVQIKTIKDYPNWYTPNFFQNNK
jgi:hypothetical protein